MNIAQIDAEYANAQNAANYWLSQGNPQAANDAHRVMQNLVAQRDAIVSAGSGGGGGNSGPSSQDLYYDQLRAQLDQQQREAREAASSFLRSTLSTYSMDSLAARVDDLVRQWGTNTEVIAEKLRQTDEYKERFKGLLGLQQRGITDVRNEAQYLQLESGYREVFRQAGIQSFLGDAGSAAERDSIADIVGKFSLSVDEVRARVDDAQRVVAESPPEVREALQRFYNVPANELVAYTLDPERTMNRINRMANAAIVGGSAAQRGLDIDLTTAELTADLAGDQDINPAQVSADMTRSRMLRDTTRRLAEIEKSTLTDSEVVQSQLNLSADAQQRVRGLQSRERARFSGSSGITSAALNRTRGM